MLRGNPEGAIAEVVEVCDVVMNDYNKTQQATTLLVNYLDLPLKDRDAEPLKNQKFFGAERSSHNRPKHSMILASSIISLGVCRDKRGKNPSG